MRPILCVLTACWVCGSAWGQTDKRPEALVNLVAYRAALRTGVVEHSYETRYIRTSVDGAEQRSFRYATGRFANGDLIWINRGDEEGVMSRFITGEPCLLSTTPQNPVHDLLTADGQRWEHEEQKKRCYAFTPEAVPMIGGMINPQSLGVGISSRNIHDAVWSQPYRNFTERKEGHLHVVTAETNDGCTRCWWIDGQRGWNPVRITNTKDDLVIETRVTLKEFDGVWFPETVEIYNSAWKEGREPTHSVRVFSATFNRPDHPQRFTPEDIGITKGMDAILMNGNLHEVDDGFYDGRKYATIDEYLDQKRAELLAAQGDETASHAADARTLATRLTTFESEWEAYTRQFIERYRLGEDQAQKAWQILKDCQAQARAYLAKRLTQIEKLAEAMRDLKAADAKARAAEVAAHLEALQKLYRPIEDIFERQLKPRLDRLPTRTQRAAADETPPPGPVRSGK